MYKDIYGNIVYSGKKILEIIWMFNIREMIEYSFVYLYYIMEYDWVI